MKARNYNTLISVWINAEVSDGFGGFINSETLVKNIWAKIQTKNAGFKFQQYGLNDFKNPVIFSVRQKNNLDITEKHFIQYNGQKYQIKSIEKVNLDNVELNIYADGDFQDLFGKPLEMDALIWVLSNVDKTIIYTQEENTPIETH